MFKKLASVILLVLILLGFNKLTASAASLEIKDSVGWDIYNGGSYRYGPSIIINSDNSIDMWTSAPGSGGAWDYIKYRHSTNGGLTWTTDVDALAPTPGSDDAYSTCDPGVIKIGSYYYIGYTSTKNSAGVQNELYVARSTSPSGGFEKWNGSGWGGNPKAFITYSGDANGYGIGEPSFVDLNGTLYIYYSYISSTVNQTRVNTVSDTNSNWPGATTYRGVAIEREGSGGLGASAITEDSTDIKYVDSMGKFIGVAVCRRLQADAYSVAYESTDGISFARSVFVNIDRQNYSHNIGISGTSSGHFNTSNSNFVAFAYGPNWGSWNTHLSPITLMAQPVGITYQAHVQDIGWQNWVSDSILSGTTGQSKRVEAVKIQLTSPLSGMYIVYQAHVQNIGWQSAVRDGAIAGTTGQSLRMEAIRIVLQGSVPSGYHVKYRVYQESYGWSNWFVDNQQAGVTGVSKTIEAIEIFVYKD